MKKNQKKQKQMIKILMENKNRKGRQEKRRNRSRSAIRQLFRFHFRLPFRFQDQLFTSTYTKPPRSTEGEERIDAALYPLHLNLNQTNTTIDRRDLICSRVNLVIGRLGGSGLRMLLVPTHESRTQCREIHLEAFLVRMVSV